MKKKSLLKVITISALSFLPLALPAAADIGADDMDVSANVGFVTDYAFRGISQSNETVALQGGFDVSHNKGLYAGVWGSNVNFNDGDEASVETDIYAGYSKSVNGINYDVGAIYYAYPRADSALNYDFWEASFAVGYDFQLFSASASVNHSPEFFGETGKAQYYAASVDVPLPKDVTLSTHLGRQNIERGNNYTDWSVGLGYALEGFDLSLKYVDTNLDEPTQCVDGCESRVIFGVSKSF